MMAMFFDAAGNYGAGNRFDFNGNAFENLLRNLFDFPSAFVIFEFFFEFLAGPSADILFYGTHFRNPFEAGVSAGDETFVAMLSNAAATLDIFFNPRSGADLDVNGFLFHDGLQNSAEPLLFNHFRDANVNHNGLLNHLIIAARLAVTAVMKCAGRLNLNQHGNNGNSQTKHEFFHFYSPTLIPK